MSHDTPPPPPPADTTPAPANTDIECQRGIDAILGTMTVENTRINGANFAVSRVAAANGEPLGAVIVVHGPIAMEAAKLAYQQITKALLA